MPFVLIALLGVAAIVWLSTDPNADRGAALAAADTGRFDQVEPQLKALADRNPDDAEVTAALARGYLRTGNAEAAEFYITRWVNLRPDNPEPLRLRYEFYLAAKNTERAYPDGLKLLELDPTDSPLRREAKAKLRRTTMGQAFSLGRFEDAERLCRECLSETPADRGLRSMLAEILRAKGDGTGAAAVLDDLLKDFPEHTPAMMARGILFLESGQPDRAVPLFREVLKTDRTRQRSAGYQLVIALERTGQVEEAKKVAADMRRLQEVEVYGDAMKSQPDNLEIRVRLAERLLADGHTQEGVANLEAVLKIDPRYRPAHLALAAHYDRQGQPERAAEHRKLAGPNP